MSSRIDDLLAKNAAYAEAFARGDLPSPPAKRIAVVTCMDARIDVHRILGVEEGDVHVIRNAGGLVTQDALRSLILSQRVLLTETVMIIQHTRCGLLNLPEEDIKQELEAEVGASPDFSFGGFSDLEASVRNAVAAIKDTPFLLDSVRGFVYDVETGRLQEVTD